MTFVLCAHVVEEEKQPVVYIDLTDAWIKVQTKEVKFRVQFVQFFLNTFREDVICYAAKGL